MTPINIFHTMRFYNSSLYTNINSHKIDVNIKVIQSWVYHFHAQRVNHSENSQNWDFCNMVPFIYSISILTMFMQNMLNECKYSNSNWILLLSKTNVKAQKTVVFLCDDKNSFPIIVHMGVPSPPPFLRHPLIDLACTPFKIFVSLHFFSVPGPFKVF